MSTSGCQPPDRTSASFFLLVGLLAWAPAPAAGLLAQTPPDAGKADSLPPAEVPTGDLPFLDQPQARQVWEFLSLGASRFDSALAVYFGKLYQRRSLDWVVFVRPDRTDTTGTAPPIVTTALIQQGKQVRETRSAHYVWALIFVETHDTPASLKAARQSAADTARARRLRTFSEACAAHGRLACTLSEREFADLGGGGPPGGTVIVRRRTVNHKRDAGLSVLFRALARGVGADPASAGALADSVVPVPLRRVVRAADGERLWFYFGYQRFGLSDNATVMLGVSDPSATVPVNERDIHETFTNGSSQKLLAGLGIGATLLARDTSFTDDPSVEGVTANTRPNVYLMGTALIRRPLLPKDERALGVTLGTNLLAGDPFRDLVLGFYVKWWSALDLGAVVGANYISRTRRDQSGARGLTREYRTLRPFLGFKFTF